MEWNSVEAMELEVRQSVKDGRRACYGSCCHQIQSQEQHRQHVLLQKLERYRQQSIEVQAEREANTAFVGINIVSTLLHHLQLWLLLKSDRVEEAWNELVEAQDTLQCALRFVDDALLRRWSMELLALERLLFPPQRFASSSHTFRYAECTICNKEYGECEHVAGRLYMGRMCAMHIKDLVTVDHIAIVDQPRDKGCRAIKVKRDGYMYCTLTLRKMEKADNDRGDAEFCVLRSR